MLLQFLIFVSCVFYLLLWDVTHAGLKKKNQDTGYGGQSLAIISMVYLSGKKMQEFVKSDMELLEFDMICIL